MVDYSQELTQEFIDQGRSYLDKVWSESHGNWENTDSFVGLTYDVWPTATLNANRVSYRPSTARQKIKHAVDVLLAFDPIIHSEPSRESRAARERSDDLEKAVTEIVTDSFMRMVTPPPWLINWYLLVYNYAVLEAPILAEGNMATRPVRPRRGGDESPESFQKRTASWRAESKLWNPIEFRVPNPSSVLMDPEQLDVQMAIKITTMTAIDLHELSKRKKTTRKSAVVFNLDKGQEFEDIALEDVWTKNWHMLKRAKGEPIYLERNTWGYVPFIQGFGGFGQTAFDNNLKKRTEGILDPIKGSLLRQAQNWSAKHNILIRHAYANIMTTGSPEELAQAMATDGIMEVKNLDEVGAANFPEVSRQLFLSGAEIDADIDRQIPGILGGQRTPGVTTVGQQAIQSTAAQRAFALTQRATEYMFSTALQRILRLIDTQDMQILNLNKSLIGGNYRMFATFPQIDPAIQMARTDINMRKVSQGLMSRQTFWEEEGLANTGKEENRLILDKIKQLPEIAQLIGRSAAQAEGIGEEFDEAVNPETDLSTNPNARDGGVAPETGLREVLDPNTVSPARINSG